MISMHGESDHIVPMWQADQTVEIFQEAGWDVTILRHHKGIHGEPANKKHWDWV